MKRSLSPSSSSLNDDKYQQLMRRHKKRKLSRPDAPELRTAGISIDDVMMRTYTQMTAASKTSARSNEFEQLFAVYS